MALKSTVTGQHQSTGSTVWGSTKMKYVGLMQTKHALHHSLKIQAYVSNQGGITLSKRLLTILMASCESSGEARASSRIPRPVKVNTLPSASSIGSAICAVQKNQSQMSALKDMITGPPPKQQFTVSMLSLSLFPLFWSQTTADTINHE